VWTDDNAIHWQQFDSTETPRTLPMTIPANVRTRASISANADRFLIVWDDETRISGLLISNDGRVIAGPMVITDEGFGPDTS
jgi:hypothetical protein